MTRWSGYGMVLAGLLACAAPNAAYCAQAAVDKTLAVDLAPLIDAAAKKREHFAVSVRHAVVIDDKSSWTSESGITVWRYSVRIPSAVSMSFHADRFKLPRSAALLVTGVDGSVATYVPGDGSELGLWSRIQRGDTLWFELRVPSGTEAQVEFSLESLQAGYRGLGCGALDHPYFRGLRKAQGAVAVGCIENFACHATAENSRNADATAAIVVGGVSLCTATLINNLRNDATPYLLTARHCQDQPSSGVVVYWDAVKPCGLTLGSVYETTSFAYLHRTETVFEQQDIWMLRLTSPISALRTYFAGWDATGGTFIGGYSPHHAMGRSRQYAEWFGQAASIALPGSALGVGFDSNYWGVVNSVGSVGSGASGGGLFTMDHRLVGVASLADLSDGPGSDGVCPAVSPPAPNGTTATALYNSFAAVWESNADPTSSTNPVTLKSLLDPDNTGSRVADGFEMLQDVGLFTGNEFQATGSPITLTWSARAATSCTASGGVPGDGWAGPRAVSGSAEIIQYDAGLTTYTIHCVNGTRFATRSVRVTWNLAQPSLLLANSTSSDYLGTAVHMFWRGTAVPCVASGGAPGDDWAGQKNPNGSQDVPLLQVGETSYTMTCGTGPRAAVETVRVRAFPPVAMLEPLVNTIRVNSILMGTQTAGGANCTRTGGAPDDGWTSVTGSYPLRLQSAVPGTYTYTLTCFGGPYGSVPPARATMTLTYTNDAPAVTLTASQASAEISGSVFETIDDPRFAIEFHWVANMTPCQLTYDGPGDNDGYVHPEPNDTAAASHKSWQFVPGTYVYTVTCRSGADVATASQTVEFTPQTPRVGVFIDTSRDLARDQVFSVGWTSNLSSSCVASGGAPGDGWAGPANPGGVKDVQIAQAGTYTYTMTCGTAPDITSGSKTITIPPPALEFEPHVSQMLANHGIELRWRGTVSHCIEFGDWSNTTPQFAIGSDTTHASTSGVRTYGIRCGIDNPIEATTQVTWLPLPEVNITASAATASVNQPVTLTWSATDADSCTAQDSMGAGMPDWNGSLPASGSRTISRSTPGPIGYYINCGDVLDAVVVEWRAVTSSPSTPAAPSVTFTADRSTLVAGEAVTLSWTATHAAVCRGSRGVTGDGWVGALPVSGTRRITVSTPGSNTWEISCEGAPPAALASVSATFSAAPGGGSNGGSSGGGGGGGSFNPLLLALLALMALISSAGPNLNLRGQRRLRSE